VKSGSLREKNHPAAMIFTVIQGYFSPVAARLLLTGFAGTEEVITSEFNAVKSVLCFILISPW
ncbi:hypothetical protein ACVGWC_12850, partial [Enterobacter hormaechei]